MGGFGGDELQAIVEYANGQEALLLLSKTSAMVQLRVAKGDYRKVLLRLHAPEGYGVDSSILVEMTSKTIEDAILVKLGAEVEQVMRKKSAGKAQLLDAVKMVETMICKNRLLYCKPEIDRFLSDTSLLQLDGGDSVKISATKGTIVLEQHEGPYWAKVRVTVPDEYPDAPARVVFLGSNIHPQIVRVFQMRVDALADRIMTGFRYLLPAVRKELELEREERMAAVVAAGGGGTGVGPSTAILHGIRKDVQFLKELQYLDTQKDEKDSRRKKSRMVKKEKAVMRVEEEEEAAALQRQRAKEEEEMLVKAMGDQSIQGDVHPTVFPLVAFVVEEVIRRLPRASCPICSKSLLPATVPAEWLTKMPAGAEMKDDIRIERLACNDWYHYRCMEQFVHEPPFEGKVCLVCKKEIKHKLWSRKRISKLEQRWKKREEKERELADVMEFMS